MVEGSKLELSVGREERASEPSLLVEGFDLGQALDVVPDPDDGFEALEVVGVELFEVVGDFSNFEIYEGQIAEGEVFVGDEVVELFQLGLDLVVVDSSLIGVVVGRIEHVQS